MGYFRLTFYYPVSDSFKDWNRLLLILWDARVMAGNPSSHSHPYHL